MKRKTDKHDLWTIGGKTFSIGIERKTGFIRSARFPSKQTDLFAQTRGGIPGYIGGLRIYDERDDRWYDDRRTPFTVEKAFKRGNKAVVTKRYKGAPFTVTVTLRAENDVLHWEVEAVKRNPKVADRSLRVYFMFPLIAGWDVWAPCKWGEQTFDGMTPFEFMYTQTPFVSDQEIILPMVSHFDRESDVGYSMVEPIDANVPAAKFVFNNGDRCFNWGSMRKDPKSVPVLEAVNYYVGLVGDRAMRTKVMLFFHEGDWRPGLGLVYKRWREFFDPFNDAIYDREGVFMCGTVAAAGRAGKLREMGLKTLEVHGHFQEYCDYYQDGKDRWMGGKEGLYRVLRRRASEEGRDPDEVTAFTVEEFIASHSEREIAETLGLESPEAMYHCRSEIKRRLAIFKEHGISNHWYFNYTDGYRPRVERDWPDSIAKNEDGTSQPSGWHMCHNMNADPRWSFGRFMIESARKIFDDYGDLLDGFFLDCFRHYEIDFAHDDGVTVVNGKPAYSMNRSYDDIERIIKTRIMKPRNLTSFANKPMSLRSMRYCDGQLLEGNGDQYEEKFFWASIANPMFFMWTRSDVPLDEFLRRAVLHGCFPRDAECSEENIALYKRYLRLYAAFSRRVLCFEPDPLRAPAGSRGKLYTLPDGGYVAGIVNLNVADGDRVKWGKTPYALFRVRRGHNVSRAGIMYPGDTEWRDLRFNFDGTFIAVPMREYVNCAVVKLFVTGRGRKGIGPDRFHQRARMCGDPESAFEDVSRR